MRILYDLTVTQERGKTKYHGGGEYGKAVFANLIENLNNNILVVIIFKNRPIEKWIKDILIENKIKTYEINGEKDIYNICLLEKINIFYSALPIAYKKRPVPACVIMKGTIHGLRGIEKPSDKYAGKYYSGYKKVIRLGKNFLPNIVRKVHINQTRKVLLMLEKCITVSEHTKYSIITHFCASQDLDIEVFYTPQKKIETLQSEISDKKFILIISANRWLKNSYRAIKALDKIFSNAQLEDYTVKVIGDAPNNIKKSIVNKKKFVFFEYLSAEELEKLYATCTLFLYPTLNEGFGMPPVEAMKYGKTCIISGICSLPEIYEEAAYYVDPTDIDEIKTRIYTAIENPICIDVIKKKYNKIIERQIRDLKEICNFIIQDI